MKKYGIDFDGTIADTNKMKSAWIAENLGKHVDPWNTDRTNCVPLIGLENYERMGEVVYQREWLLRTPEIPGAFNGLSELSKRADLYVVTMRGKKTLEFVREWLTMKNAIKYFAGLGMIENDDGTKKSKEKLCKELGLDCLIDDDERHLVKIQIPGLQRVLIKNGIVGSYSVPQGIDFASSWDDVLRVC